MFKIAPKDQRTFTHDVPIMEPVDGGFRTDTLKTTFRALSIDEVDKFNIRTAEGTDALLDAAVVSFHELFDWHDQPLPYSPEVRAVLLNRQNVRQGLLAHYFDAVAKVKTGN